MIWSMLRASCFKMQINLEDFVTCLLHRWYIECLMQSHTQQLLSMCRQNFVRGWPENFLHQEWTHACWVVFLRASTASTAVHTEDCEGWWLSGCRGSVAEHGSSSQRCPGFNSWWLLAFSLYLIHVLWNWSILLDYYHYGNHVAAQTILPFILHYALNLLKCRI